MQPESEDFIPAEPVSAEPAEIEPPVPETPVPERKPFWGYVDLALVLGLLLAFLAAIMLGAAAFVFAVPSLRRDQGPLLFPTPISPLASVYLQIPLAFALCLS